MRKPHFSSIDKKTEKKKKRKGVGEGRDMERVFGDTDREVLLQCSR